MNESPFQKSLLEFIEFLSNTKNVILYLQEQNILIKKRQCPKCDKTMNIREYNNCNEKYIWRCISCRKVISVKTDSWFANSKLQMKNGLLILYFYFKVPEIPFS